MLHVRAAHLTVTIALLPLIGACAIPASGENAACVSPYIDDQRPNGDYGAPAATVSPGDALTIFGHWYTDTCNDTNPATADPKPLPSVRLTLILPDGSTRDLGLATPAGPDVGFQVTVQVPPSAKDGPASVSDDRTPPAKYHFTVKPAT
jgi:hypothetical protein